VCEKLIKNSQPFGKKFQKTLGGIFLTHIVCMYVYSEYSALGALATMCYTNPRFTYLLTY